ncbi:MAG: hypothetical protein AAF360_15780 [Pseudomonadota bacterium]
MRRHEKTDNMSSREGFIELANAYYAINDVLNYLRKKKDNAPSIAILERCLVRLHEIEQELQVEEGGAKNSDASLQKLGPISGSC